MVRASPRSASLAVRPQGELGQVVTITLRAFCTQPAATTKAADAVNDSLENRRLQLEGLTGELPHA